MGLRGALATGGRGRAGNFGSSRVREAVVGNRSTHGRTRHLHARAFLTLERRDSIGIGRECSRYLVFRSELQRSGGAPSRIATVTTTTRVAASVSRQVRDSGVRKDHTLGPGSAREYRATSELPDRFKYDDQT